jgi:hypothetical protein
MWKPSLALTAFDETVGRGRPQSPLHFDTAVPG